jgi:hypothetical protein
MLGITDAVELSRQVAELVKKGITIDLQERIMQLREAVQNAKDEVLTLREENQQMKDRVQTDADLSVKLAKYHLVKTSGSAVVNHTDGPPEHFACPRCYEDREIQILQPDIGYSGRALCPGCAAVRATS